MKRLAILGAGHLGQQIAHFAIHDGHYVEVVFFDDFTNEKEVKGYKVLGKSKNIMAFHKNGHFDDLIIGVGYKHLSKRKELFEKFTTKIPFGTIVHSSCWVDTTAVIGSGSVIYPNCCLDAYTMVRENSIINISSTIAHDSIIGRHCFLSPRVAIAGFVTVADQCIIGINTTIIDNIKISSEIQLGGGTVVIDHLTDKGLYVGNPARFIR